MPRAQIGAREETRERATLHRSLVRRVERASARAHAMQNGANASTSAGGHGIGRIVVASKHVHVISPYPTHAPSSANMAW